MTRRMASVSPNWHLVRIPVKPPPLKWWLMNPASRIQYAGIDAAGFSNDAELNGAAPPGLTIISGLVTERARQFGYIRQIKIYIRQVGLGIMKFKLFRPNGGNFDFVAESTDTIVGSGSQTLSLNTPLPCQPGDILGVYLFGDANNANLVKIGCKNAVGANLIRYTSGDISATDPFATTINNLVIDIEGLGISPCFTITGDSIASGYNFWQSFYDSGPAGSLSNEPWYSLRQLIKSDQIDGFEYQNHSKNAEIFTWIQSTGIVSALATGANRILIHCGINDIQAGRSWANVLANLNAIRLLIPDTVALFIDEILPWTAGSDANALTVRTWNSNLNDWCQHNNVTLIHCHDSLGQLRISTGELDDLKTIYDADGVHLTATGYSKLAFIVKTYLT